MESKYADTYKKITSGCSSECFEACLIESVKISGDEVVPDYSGQTVPDNLLYKKEGSV